MLAPMADLPGRRGVESRSVLFRLGHQFGALHYTLHKGALRNELATASQSTHTHIQTSGILLESIEPSLVYRLINKTQKWH